MPRNPPGLEMCGAERKDWQFVLQRDWIVWISYIILYRYIHICIMGVYIYIYIHIFVYLYIKYFTSCDPHPGIYPHIAPAGEG